MPYALRSNETGDLIGTDAHPRIYTTVGAAKTSAYQYVNVGPTHRSEWFERAREAAKKKYTIVKVEINVIEDIDW